jgi:Pseudouridine synthase II TruB, C-terminal
VLESPQLESVVHGQRLPAAELGSPPIPAGPVALLDSAGNLVALGELDPRDGWLQPRKVLI